jgi:hypothetical protein
MAIVVELLDELDRLSNYSEEIEFKINEGEQNSIY